MTTRRVFLSAILIPAWLALGCSAPSALPAPAELPAAEQKKEAKLPQAPPPHAKKTTAELLVGKWREVSTDGEPLVKGYEATLEFTKDGKVCFRVEKSPRRIPPPRFGKYWLKGNLIQYAVEPTTETPRQDWSVIIKQLDEQKMVLTVPEVSKGNEYVRIPEK
jgi:uncharacterized protein (TIGR03066 family)